MNGTNILIIIEIFFTIVIGLYFLNALKKEEGHKVVVYKENKKEKEKLRKLKSISLTVPLTEKTRPTSLEDIIGQEEGIKALKAALCSPNPQNIIIYGPPGVGKTAAARVVLEYAKKLKNCPFNQNSKFVEIDATTVRFDERGIADPLIGSVHDPIYQGAGPLGVAGIPQPKPGAVTKAHGGILFIDEIGELHPIEMNKLLKVLEDRKVFLESSYYNSEDSNVPDYIKDIFDNGLPADFRLIGATTRRPEEIVPALRSRCVEIFFRELLPEEIEKIAQRCVIRIGFQLEDKACKTIGKYASNGRDAINLIQLSAGIATNENRNIIKNDDVEWVIQNGQYTARPEKKIYSKPRVGCVNGLAVYGANMGMIMEIEASAKKVNRKGKLKITGIVGEEQINGNNKTLKRMSTARCSVENAITVIENILSIDCDNYDIHVNFPGGMPVDGPSAGISITTAIYSAITKKLVDNEVAMTGEIALYGAVKAIGGVNAKIQAAKKAGAKIIIIPEDNYRDIFKEIKNVKIIPVNNIKQVFEICLKDNNSNDKSHMIYNNKSNVVLSAQ